MIGIILFISLSFLICVFFYKQSNPDYSLNQLEFEKIDKLHEILFEKNPIILNHVPQIP